jgi:hypothetical protein
VDGLKLSRERVSELLGDLCVELGFCLPCAAQNRLESDPPHCVEAFTDAVFVSDGINPHFHPGVRDQVRRRVADYFEICKLLDDETDHVADQSHRQLLLDLLTVPRRRKLMWEYGWQERLTCWQVGQSTDNDIWLVYCEDGFGPSFPWGFVFPESQSLGNDGQWYSGLVDAAIGAGLLVAPDDYQSPGPRNCT